MTESLGTVNARLLRKCWTKKRSSAEEQNTLLKDRALRRRMNPLFRKKAPLSLTTWTVLSLNLSARDKLVKIIQYVARLLMWYYQRVGAEESSLLGIQKVSVLES